MAIHQFIVFLKTAYIQSIQSLLNHYKSVGERAMAQVDEQRLFWVFNNDSNSIAILVQHLHGNMLSRFTHFYEEDGEKSWRNRDLEFEPVLTSRIEVMKAWDAGWACVFGVTHSLRDLDLDRTVYLRGEAITVAEALNKHLAHYAYHVGQIVFLCKMLAQSPWMCLSIPKSRAR